MAAASARDVLAYMRSLGHTFTGEVQAHKLAYYAQAWSLAWDGAPLFDEPVEAWDMGPVVRSLRGMTAPALNRLAVADTPPLTDQQKENVKAVLAFYGRMNGKQLAALSHSESPWREVHDRAGATNHEPISPGSMRREYAARAARREAAPTRSFLGASTPDPVALERMADESVKRWDRTLAILANAA